MPLEVVAGGIVVCILPRHLVAVRLVRDEVSLQNKNATSIVTFGIESL